MGKVTIHRTKFLEDEICDGDYGPSTVTDSTDYECGAREAASLIRWAGLRFYATGTDWAAHPDGSYIASYATGERIEETAHLSGFPDRVVAAIVAAVDTERTTR